NDFSVLVHYEAVPIKHQFILASHSIEIGNNNTAVVGPGSQHFLSESCLADIIGGGIDIDNQFRAPERLDRAWATLIPDVLADRNTEQKIFHFIYRISSPRLKISELVK